MDKFENLDELDRGVLVHLGYALARAQLLEFAMVKLLEAKNHDTSSPLEDRWEEIDAWLHMTAGKLRRLLGVPAAVATDLQSVIARRNQVVHRAWMGYQTTRGLPHGDAAAGDWSVWLDEQAWYLGHAYNGLSTLTALVRSQVAGSSDDAELERVWREHVPDPIPPY